MTTTDSDATYRSVLKIRNSWLHAIGRHGLLRPDIATRLRSPSPAQKPVEPPAGSGH